jgi:glycosyltransferase involved in cell wall biosynthesis
VPAILTHGEHGLLAPLGDYDALGAQVLRLLDDPALARRLARAALQSCQRCTWSAVRQQWLRLYESVLPSTASHTARATTHDSPA